MSQLDDARHALLSRPIDHAPVFPPASLPPDKIVEAVELRMDGDLATLSALAAEVEEYAAIGVLPL